MEDIGDPNYQKYALRFTDAMTKHYANHPALLAFGIDNESGDGRISYSETSRQRFITWLKNKYTSIRRLLKKILSINTASIKKIIMTPEYPEKTL